MKDLYELLQRAANYTWAYSIQYGVTDKDLQRAIFVSHLAHLLNS